VGEEIVVRLKVWLGVAAGLIALKLLGVVGYSWFVVTAPLWGPVALVVAWIMVAIVGCAVLALLLGGDG
jgi:hypothetical protein